MIKRKIPKRHQASQQLSEFIRVVQAGDYLVLDTETTGLDGRAEVIEIAIVKPDGYVLLDTRIKPRFPIPAEATAIHGITNEDVQRLPEWRMVFYEVRHLLEGQNIICYNVDYDRRILQQTGRLRGKPDIEADWFCAMKAFAELYGEPGRSSGQYRWKKLIHAAGYYGIDDDGAHSALADTLMTLAVAQKMAGPAPLRHERATPLGGFQPKRDTP